MSANRIPATRRRLARVAMVAASVMLMSVTAVGTAIAEPENPCAPGDPCDVLPDGLPGEFDIVEPIQFVTLPGIISVVKATAEAPPVLTVQGLPTVTGLADAQSGEALSIEEDGAVAGYALGDTAAATGGPTGSGYACINNATNPSFRAFQAVTLSGSNKTAQYRWQFSPYAQYGARTYAGKGTWQFEICAVGGVDGQNGYRTFYNASVLAADSTDGNRRIGLAADNGSDGSASASISFAVAAGPVTISGAIPTSGGQRYGQYGSPKYASHADRFNATESFAGWKANCTYARTCGSSNMQSQVHHGLFEFFNGDYNRNFPVDAQYNFYCSGPYGQGCG